MPRLCTIIPIDLRETNIVIQVLHVVGRDYPRYPPPQKEKLSTQELGVLVCNLPRQNLVTYHQDCCTPCEGRAVFCLQQMNKQAI